jgi:hypothetical protein
MLSRDPSATARSSRPNTRFHLGASVLLDVPSLLYRMAGYRLLVELPTSRDIAEKVALTGDVFRRKDGQPKC